MQVLVPIGFPTTPSAAELRQWSVLQLADDDGQAVRVAVGLLGKSATRVRITSPIERFDGGHLLTTSGSTYSLIGDPATADQVGLQAGHRRVLLGGREAVDVTSAYSSTL